MSRISSDRVLFEFAPGAPPVATVTLGKPFVVETRDALDGHVRPGQPDVPDDIRPNPATGPIAIDGIGAGDLICVDILSVDPVPSGYLTLGGIPEFFQQRGGRLEFLKGILLVMEPMIGTIGVSPASGRRSTKEAGDHGGNMDTRDIAAGASLYLTTQVDGGGLALGDVHSLQGDGEIGGQGVETAATVTLRVRRAGQPLTHRPYVVRDGRLMIIISDETVDRACKAAVEETTALLAQHSTLDEKEARMLLSVAGDLRIGQIVNPQKTVRLSLPVDVIPWVSTPIL